MKTQLQEAVKTALAVVLVYGFALQTSWMNPNWGAFVVVLIALPSPGSSLRKGLLRLGGTIPGCLAALVILALAPQDRWLFLALTCGWILLTTYLSLARPGQSYLWFTSGLTTLLIGSSQGSSQELFRMATYRTLETELGIVVYMLVSLFLWPRPDPAPEATAGAVPETPSPWIDLDHLRGALFAAAATAAGFLMWVLLDPPGHSGWMVLPGALAMQIAQIPQLRVTVFVRPLAVAIPLAMAVYLFVLPELTTFGELAVVLFTLLVINLVLNSGIAQAAGNIAIINIISIQNHQVYVFAPIANAALFLFMGFYFVFGLSYIMGSARPEKKLLALVDRFFRSAAYLVSRPKPDLSAAPGRTRWKVDRCRHDLLTLPLKIKTWGGTIDQELFPDNPPERAQELATRLEELGRRLVAFFDAERSDDASPDAAATRREVANWRSRCTEVFPKWQDPPPLSAPDPEAGDASSESAGDVGEASPGLVGHCRAVTAAASAFAAAAKEIDWNHWREERFS